jgi:hypothetical protein
MLIQLHHLHDSFLLFRNSERHSELAQEVCDPSANDKVVKT